MGIMYLYPNLGIFLIVKFPKMGIVPKSGYNPQSYHRLNGEVKWIPIAYNKVANLVQS